MDTRTTTEPATRRRQFLTESWTWIRAMVAAVFVYPLFRFIGYEVPSKPRLIEVTRKFPINGFLLEKDFILFQGDNRPWAVSRKCTHLGCRLNYLEKEKQLECPCHQSRFLTSGKRVAGPARRDLPIFPVVEIKEGGQKGYIVTLKG